MLKRGITRSAIRPKPNVKKASKRGVSLAALAATKFQQRKHQKTVSIDELMAQRKRNTNSGQLNFVGNLKKSKQHHQTSSKTHAQITQVNFLGILKKTPKKQRPCVKANSEITQVNLKGSLLKTATKRKAAKPDTAEGLTQSKGEPVNGSHDGESEENKRLG
mmetsp:Transcript_11751/g.21487  ORF Transcript_11751/g.21487 Transcript_11751/m.21487 type:complete len:162 (+) Transcript_11751:180-665(+)